MGATRIKIPELFQHGSYDRLAELHWNSVSYLTLHGLTLASGQERVGKRHKTQEFWNPETPRPLLPILICDVLPMKGAHPRSRLRLNRRRWLGGIQSQQERPIARPPFEYRLTTIPIRVPKVVLTWRDFSGKIRKRPFGNLTPSPVFPATGPAIASPAVTKGFFDAWLRSSLSVQPPCVAAGKSRGSRPVARRRTRGVALRNPELRRDEHFPLRTVAKIDSCPRSLLN